ncbi:MAG TPA: serine hydrolase [Actinophytocola sp.]|uniref:serine hydrolase domain-containing protein n=1 Tax=Actinophytocola sp. TaxID=1872138 RepID=UPI002DBA6248|nr:serine hydrolase [Actinophytocola sp.]HEU5469679.1 serine hydrolase [Actinophytocola sp.]
MGWLRWCASVLVLSSMPVVAAQPAEPDATRIEAFLTGRMRANEVPGLAYALVHRDRVVRSGAWGVDGWGRPMTPRTPMGFGSVSKPVTATAIMRLVDTGRVRLDDPVVRQLPWLRLAEPDTAGKITVRHLLEQTSGISPRDGYARSDRDDNAPGGIRRWVGDLASAHPTAQPGQLHQYSPANAMILAALAEQVTGLSFADFLHRELFAPLDMADTITDAHKAERMPPGHEYYFGSVRRAPKTFDTSGVPYGYLAGSVTDLAHLAILHTNAGRYRGTAVLSQRAIAQLHRPGPVAAGGHYGPGWRIGTLNAVGTRIVWHAGAVTGYHTLVITAPDRGWAVAVQQNAWSFLHDAALNAAGFGALTLALGGEPDPPTPPSATLPLLALGAVILILAVGLAVTAHRLLRPARSRRSWPTVLGATTGAMAGLMSAVGLGWWLPHAFDLDLRHILRFQPDLGHLTIAIITLGLALTATATALLIRTLLTRHSGQAQPKPR